MKTMTISLPAMALTLTSPLASVVAIIASFMVSGGETRGFPRSYIVAGPN